MAINQIDRDLNERLTSLTQSLANGNASLQRALNDHAKRLTNSHDDEMDAYSKRLDNLRSWDTEEGKAAKARLLRLKKLEDESKNYLIENLAKRKAIDKETRDLEDRKNKLQAKLVNAPSGKRGDIQKNIKQIEDSIGANKQTKDALIKQDMVTIDAAKKAKIARDGIEREQGRLTTKWGQQFRSGVSTAATGAIEKAFGGGTFIAAVTKLAEHTFDAIKTGAKTGGYGLSMNPFGDNAISMFGAAKLGLDQKEFAKVSAASRQTIMSSNRGMNEFVDGMKKAGDEYSGSIIDAKERTDLAITNMDRMAKSGIRFTAADATAYRASMEQTAKLTGMTAQDYSKNLTSLMEDENVQNQLKTASNEQERRAIMDGINQQFAQNKAMGMTTEQANAAAKALSKLAGEKPLERFKKAAKIRAFGAAMGMGADANRMADLEIKGKRRTADENAEYQKIGGQMSEALTQTGTGSLSSEIFATTLADKLQLDTLLGPSSPFNTTLAQAVAPMQSAADSMTKLPAALVEALSAAQTAYSSIMSNDLAKVMLVGLGALFKDQIFGALRGIVGSVASSAATTAATTTATTAASTAAGGAATAAGGVAAGGAAATAGVVALAATALAAGGTALYAGYKAAKGEDSSNWISEGFDKMTGGWNMFEALDRVVGGPLSEQDKKLATVVETTKKATAPQTPEQEQKKATAAAATEANGPSSEDTKKEDAKKKTVLDSAKRMDLANDFLKTIADTGQKQLDLAEKQLVAMTMSEKERESAKSNLRKDNRFGAQYGYV